MWRDASYVSPSWMSRGACQREDPELFFPGAGGGTAVIQVRAAKAVCGACAGQESVPVVCHRHQAGRHLGRSDGRRTARPWFPRVAALAGVSVRAGWAMATASSSVPARARAGTSTIAPGLPVPSASPRQVRFTAAAGPSTREERCRPWGTSGSCRPRGWVHETNSGGQRGRSLCPATAAMTDKQARQGLGSGGRAGCPPGRPRGCCRCVRCRRARGRGHRSLADSSERAGGGSRDAGHRRDRGAASRTPADDGGRSFARCGRVRRAGTGLGPERGRDGRAVAWFRSGRAAGQGQRQSLLSRCRSGRSRLEYLACTETGLAH